MKPNIFTGFYSFRSSIRWFSFDKKFWGTNLYAAQICTNLRHRKSKGRWLNPRRTRIAHEWKRNDSRQTSHERTSCECLESFEAMVSKDKAMIFTAVKSWSLDHAHCGRERRISLTVISAYLLYIAVITLLLP